MAWEKTAERQEAFPQGSVPQGTLPGALENWERRHKLFFQQTVLGARVRGCGHRQRDGPIVLAYRPDDPQGGQRLVIASPV